MTWDIFADSLPELLAAAGGTLRMTAFAFLFAALLGLALAILRLAGGLTGRLAFLYIEIVRGMPALALLFLIYFGLAPLGLVLNSFVAAVVAAFSATVLPLMVRASRWSRPAASNSCITAGSPPAR